MPYATFAHLRQRRLQRLLACQLRQSDFAWVRPNDVFLCAFATAKQQGQAQHTPASASASDTRLALFDAMHKLAAAFTKQLGTEHKAKRGPHTHITLDEMMAKSRTVVERVRPILNRAVGKLRSRFGRK